MFKFDKNSKKVMFFAQNVSNVKFLLVMVDI